MEITNEDKAWMSKNSQAIVPIKVYSNRLPASVKLLSLYTAPPGTSTSNLGHNKYLGKVTNADALTCQICDNLQATELHI